MLLELSQGFSSKKYNSHQKSYLVFKLISFLFCLLFLILGLVVINSQTQIHACSPAPKSENHLELKFQNPDIEIFEGYVKNIRVDNQNQFLDQVQVTVTKIYQGNRDSTKTILIENGNSKGPVDSCGQRENFYEINQPYLFVVYFDQDGQLRDSGIQPTNLFSSTQKISELSQEDKVYLNSKEFTYPNTDLENDFEGEGESEDDKNEKKEPSYNYFLEIGIGAVLLGILSVFAVAFLKVSRII